MKKVFFSYIFTLCMVSFSWAQQETVNAKQLNFGRSSSKDHQQKVIDIKKKASTNKASLFIIEPEITATQSESPKPKKSSN